MSSPGASAAAGNELTISAAMANGNGATAVPKLGAGTLTLSGTAANSYTGQTTVDQGTLLLAKGAAVNAMTGTLVVGNFTGRVTLKVTSAFNNFPTVEPIIVNNSTFDISNTAITQTITTLDLRGGIVRTTGANNNILSVNNTIIALPASTGAAAVTSNSITGNLLLAATDTINVLDDGVLGLSISALISGANGITKNGAGTLTLNGTAANTYTGATTVAAGTLLLNDSGGVAIPGALTIGDSLGGQGVSKADNVRLLAPGQINTLSVVTINNSGMLDLNGNSSTIGVGQVNALTMTGGTVSTNVDAVQTITFGGTITGGAFTLTFNAQTTAPIAWSANSATLAANIVAELTDLPNIGATNVLVVPTSATTFTVTFQGSPRWRGPGDDVGQRRRPRPARLPPLASRPPRRAARRARSPSAATSPASPAIPTSRPQPSRTISTSAAPTAPSTSRGRPRRREPEHQRPERQRHEHCGDHHEWRRHQE